MRSLLKRVPLTLLGFVSLLLAFFALGTSIYALAAGSAVAGMIAVSMVILMAVSIFGFRAGARIRAESNDSGIDIPGENILATPLRREQIDRYMEMYRGVRDNHEQLLEVAGTPGGDATKLMERRAA
ncbi:hypothetical protein H7J88_18900 [Mycolicibacterium flavescens]|uniref:Uncharacterized protein n=1 Tax=Mycolicibacterium flavescens TaxID=1776 RepID=A0A1E3RM46_MYCFV|nr:hypothetical protein [Mycolicibacterium flavescens]MCV7281701.1 hypothetical protein [Mycolicibacterium flavescens]ODQ90965.1 hypothetical protein BHQ18_09315 [Mycolicibacterium flavescens]